MSALSPENLEVLSVGVKTALHQIIKGLFDKIIDNHLRDTMCHRPITFKDRQTLSSMLIMFLVE